jgi:hypothetical protein
VPDRVPTACDQCGLVDIDPKWHTLGRTVHHDCMSVAEKDLATSGSPVVADIIAACEGGLRGADLLAHIESLHKES